MRTRKPSPATVIASVALFFALGGSALAAHHFLITSTKQIKPSVLKALRGNRGPAGAQGSPGASGPPGPAATSVLSALTTVDSPEVEVPAGEVGGAEAICPAGSRAVSGGGSGSIAGIAASEIETNHQDWFIVVANQTSITIKIHAEAECAAVGQAVSASVGGHPGRQRGAVESRIRNALHAGT